MSNACNICGTCSFVVPSGIRARMSNRCELIQSGPEIWYGFTLKAVGIKSASDIYPMSTRDPSTLMPTWGSLPVVRIACGLMGSAGLMVATSNDKAAGGAWLKANVGTIRSKETRVIVRKLRIERQNRRKRSRTQSGREGNRGRYSCSSTTLKFVSDENFL